MFNQPLTLIKGIGEKKAEKLKKIGLSTFYDVLYNFPFRYLDRRHIKHVSDIETNDNGVIQAKVIRKRTKFLSKTKTEMLILDVSEGYHTGEIIFFSAKFILNDFSEGNSYYFFGKVEKNGPLFKMTQPDYATIGDSTFLGIVPVYNATAGITQSDLIAVHKQVLAYLNANIEEILPTALIAMAGVISLGEALREIHFPKTKESYLAAKKRLIYDELFFLQLRLILLKKNYHKPNLTPYVRDSRMEAVLLNLPFKLTESQKRVFEEIISDMQSGYSMNRLIQGDVGSGKTIIAFLTLLNAVFNQKQGILLAPTTLLAEQHYENFVKMYPEVSCQLLTSNKTNSEKKEIKQSLLNNETSVLIGTHAILQEDVKFYDLGVVITDEQHRFGIRQRLSALQKSDKPHALIMSATPIPRTLSLILYGDMDISVISEMPSGRKPIKTHFVNVKKIEEMHVFIEKKLEEGRQAYVVCPLIEASETLDLHAAETIFMELSNRYQNFQVGLIHGKMKATEKDDIMKRFKAGHISVLVSTTVIEVGIHVSNATTMVIMNTERFGLSQLHQLRGRVGRGEEQSYCFLLSDKLSVSAKQRIETMVNSNDGFEVAEKDLELRGPGEVFGVRQHGIPELRLANLSKDKEVIEQVQKHMKIVLEEYNLGNREFIELINKQNVNLENWFTL